MTSRDQRRAWIPTELLVGEVTTAEARLTREPRTIDDRCVRAGREQRLDERRVVFQHVAHRRGEGRTLLSASGGAQKGADSPAIGRSGVGVIRERTRERE